MIIGMNNSIQKILLTGFLLLNSFTMARPAETNVPVAATSADILTPKAGPEPRINGPLVYAVRPGSPFLYRIPCTGERPIKFSAKNLPPSLTLDAQSGIITGAISAAGTNRVTLIAHNAHGTMKREFRIVVGQQLALTPPMG